MEQFQVMRATELWQQTGAYYVRIQGMARQHNITLREEFDEHDGQDTKYIVILDGDFPVATARFYELDEFTVMIGRDDRGSRRVDPRTGIHLHTDRGQRCGGRIL